MQLSDSLLDVIQFKLVFPLSHINFLLQSSDLLQAILPLLLVLTAFLPDALQKFSNLIILESNHLPKPVQLDIEEFVLIIHTLLQVLQLEIKNLLELVPQLVKFLTLFTISLICCYPLLLYELLQSFDLLVFLSSYLLNPTRYHCLDILLL